MNLTAYLATLQCADRNYITHLTVLNAIIAKTDFRFIWADAHDHPVLSRSMTALKQIEKLFWKELIFCLPASIFASLGEKN